MASYNMLPTDDKQYSSDDDSDCSGSSIDEGGDLGLGLGLKPGAISKNPVFVENVHVTNNGAMETTHFVDRRESVSSDPSDSNRGRQPGNSSPTTTAPRRSNSFDKLKWNGGNTTTDPTTNKKRFLFGGRFTTSGVVKSTSSETGEKTYPNFVSSKRNLSVSNDCSRCGGDVIAPIGTSIRQQKLLFEQDKEDLLQKGAVDVELPKYDFPGVSIPCWTQSHQEDLEDKLARAEQEVEILRAELDRCQKQLDAKYRAIQILQKQSQVAQGEHDMSSLKIRELTRGMQQEVAPLVCMGDLSTMGKSRFTLLQERCNRTCKENASLMATLDERTLELKRLHAEKMAVRRERDELLALLDVQERMKYERNRTSQSDDAYSDFSSNEVYLAVLGACNCRQTNPEPCGCAYAAANLRKETIKLREDIELHKGRREEAYTTVDAYRMAFEEQLHRNRSLTMKIAELTAPTEKKFNKAKNVLRWLVRQLNEDLTYDQTIPTVEPLNENGNVSDRNSNDLLKCQNEQEIIAYLLEKLNDKSEALAHQRLAARMLASRTKELEERLHLVDETVPRT
ncbi:coiled-coil domain-containing protein 125-like isoform X2 [Tubulanus polymorphus]|uniref:coiled-coil domain-containing protein 125-like isoform X2 n=1 Tax=Tubulanus polymorphus TaxID=672921 RepID=UPI003DA4F725